MNGRTPGRLFLRACRRMLALRALEHQGGRKLQTQRVGRMHLNTCRAMIGLLGLLNGPAAAQEPRFDPFRQGEGFGTAATCETIGEWIDRVPDYDGRISMVITGVLKESHRDGALAYLIMCEPEDVQVMCVTYYETEVTDETILFAGGYNRAAEKQIILDPCLVYPAE